MCVHWKCFWRYVLTYSVLKDPDFYTLTDYHPEDFQSETTSITSSIARGRLENGRRYQAMKDDYWGPSDEQQFEAFEIGHMLFLILDHNEPNPLFRAPIGEQPKQILDIGTGKGSWAVDVADLYPNATVRGVDIFPPPVSWVPPNCVFEVDDVLREWTWREPFDFIHLRLMYGAFTSEEWDQVYKRAYDALQPGGWIEQMELDVRVFSDDGTLTTDKALHGWGDMFIDCSERAGRSLRTQETMRSTLEKAGFVDAQEKLYKIPPRPLGKGQAVERSRTTPEYPLEHGLGGEEVQVYLAKVRKELQDPLLHGYELARRVWARKPTLGERKADKTPSEVKPPS
ncbi:hypothetical protein N7468_010822 [Penicillium chermesinum]|uniref:S-adenosyl-L-methionine-dependent methyltransferase n=1 Tax=Penicillium chermesinum TaxID=63820 RepID=A0A9W9N8C5_9EURO|nr:uncharacterized protein N7468_010822 [Penicillium chermesinum]KAJ5215143.1 hypothetical protein N7468_010822 [Penicillium chermesinum]